MKPDTDETPHSEAPKPPPPESDFDERHGSADKRPLPPRSGDMDRPGMEPESETD